MSRLRPRFMDCTGLDIQSAESFGTEFAVMQRDIMFWIGDLARYCEARWPDTWHQAFPEWISPGLLARAAGVCRAYPTEEDRQHDCTYSQYMQVAGKPHRQQLLAEMQGQTTDESRKALKRDNVSSGEAKSGESSTGKAPAGEADARPRWLLAVDCNYYLHRWWHSGAGVEAATGVASWIERTAKRLAEEKGLTDLACCFDGANNHRKLLTEEWEDKYKDRGQKEPELLQQIHLLRDLLAQAGYAVVTVEGMEADDVMASYAKQFPGKVTLLTQDKDQRQCLSEKCNILLDVEWLQDDHSGDMQPVYKWLSAKTHTEETSVTPQLWTEYQCIAGDNVDGIRGVEGIGTKGAKDLVNEFGSVEAVIEAAKAEHESIRPKKREALIAFESKLEVTRQLVTLRDDLTIPNSTRLI